MLCNVKYCKCNGMAASNLNECMMVAFAKWKRSDPNTENVFNHCTRTDGVSTMFRHVVPSSIDAMEILEKHCLAPLGMYSLVVPRKVCSTSFIFI